MKKLIHDEKREEDVQALCNAILDLSIDSTGDYGPGGQCPLCYQPCSWKASMNEVNHKVDCAYLIAKDLKTNL